MVTARAVSPPSSCLGTTDSKRQHCKQTWHVMGLRLCEQACQTRCLVYRLVPHYCCCWPQDLTNEINEVMGQSYNIPDDVDEQDLFAELDALEGELQMEEVEGAGAPSYLQVGSADLVRPILIA